MLTLDKIILINKPQGWTSNDIVIKIRNTCGYKKVGHAGTLDPMATGLLVIGYDEGTRLLNDLMLQDKQYQTTIKFGIKTNTGDKTGSVVERQKVKLNEKQIKQALVSFTNSNYLQRPHPYSAIKINGKKAYEYARKGMVVELQPKLVKINGFKINDFNPNKQELKLTINVTKGFYVRSFAEDLAKKLNTIAHIIDLTRTKCGDFKLKNAYSLVEYLDKYGKNFRDYKK